MLAPVIWRRAPPPVMFCPVSVSDRRGYERIVYPFAPRPTFYSGARSATVLDCSERGVRLDARDADWPAVGEAVEGVVSFPDGATVRVEGAVVRAMEEEVAILFTALWISRERILAEQRRLRAHVETTADE